MNQMNPRLKKYMLMLLAIILVSTGIQAQARYRHVPRTKVDIKREFSNPDREKTTQQTMLPNTISSFIDIHEDQSEVLDLTTIENTTIASATEDVVVMKKKTQSVVKNNKMVTLKKKVNMESFADQVKENSKLMEVKDVKKPLISTGLLVMIILYGVGIILIIVALVLFFTVLSFSFLAFIIMLIIGGLLLTAASIMLSLFKMGVIS